MSTFVKKFRKGNYDDDNYFSEEEYNQKKKRKQKERKLKYYDEYEAHHKYNPKSQKFKAY